jgi:ATP-dependent Clp protease protease subunit
MTNTPHRRLGFQGRPGSNPSPEWSPPGVHREDLGPDDPKSEQRPDMGEWEWRVRETMLARRIVTLRGTLDEALAGQMALELMSLDASGDDRVTLFVDSGAGTLDAAFTVIDVIDLLGVPVQATCIGRAEGPAVGVIAVADYRFAAPHARFRLCEPWSSAQGRASDMKSFAEQQRVQLDRFVARIAEATGRPREHVEADIYEGRYLRADEALEYGLIDEIWAPAPRGRDEDPDRAPLGFRPTRPPHLSAYREDPPPTRA